MCIKIKNILFWIWPPYEAYLAEKYIKNLLKKKDEERWNDILNSSKELLPTDLENGDLKSIITKINDSEFKRKEVIENKATSLISGITISTGIIAVVPTLFADKFKIPSPWAQIAGFSYLIAVIYLLVAAYYAVQIRKVGSFACPSYDMFLGIMKEGNGKITEYMAHLVAQTKWNETPMLLKTNYLSVAEDLFLRGLSFVAFAAIVSIVVKLITN